MSASIYIETLASQPGEAARPELVMLHGWAMHGGLMKELAGLLATEFNVHLVDLPGHGGSQLNGSGLELNTMAKDIYAAVENRINGEAYWLGWSLGGLVAMKVAELYPASVSKLILLASTPAFVKQPGWQHAVDKQVFENFASDLKKDIKATITRFLSLQVRGSDDSRQTLKKLREIIFVRDMPAEQVLTDGLTILEQTDLRKQLEQLTMPVLLLGGERDTLVPLPALNELDKLQNIQTSIIGKAGHAPFLSHPRQSAELVKEFLS